MIDAVATHHLDGFRSGVARFNELLADRLGVPLLGLDRLADATHPLLSFKVAELGRDRATVERYIAGDATWEVFLHEFGNDPLEQQLVRRARRVHCGNAQVESAVGPLNEETTLLWTPGLITDERVFPDTELMVFSFGMAHKIQVDMFRKLRDLLEQTGRTFSVFVSAANHETASLRDSELVFREMHDVFPTELYFLGNLSDVAVHNRLLHATFFAAFFVGGVRANNTSVASALERGAVVITNLDEYSPREYVHMKNVIDINQADALPCDAETLGELSERARETARSRTWDTLMEALR